MSKRKGNAEWKGMLFIGNREVIAWLMENQ